jgi:hypothetical protein
MKDLLADLIDDYKCAVRDGHESYADKCSQQIVTLQTAIYNQEDIKLDRYGYPLILKEK